MHAGKSSQISSKELSCAGGALGCASLGFLVLVIWLLVGVTGCATLGRHPTPIRVTLSNIQIEEVTLFEQLYTVTLRVQNRTQFPLGLRGGSFDLVINDREFGAGVSDAQVDIPAFGDAQMQLRLVSTLFGMVGFIQGLKEGSGAPLSYEISGRLKIEGSFGGLSFREQGEFRFEQRSPSAASEPR